MAQSAHSLKNVSKTERSISGVRAIPLRSRKWVWARALWVALDAASEAGIDVSPAFEGLPFDARSVRSLHRITWDDYCDVFERLESLSGGPEAFIAIGDQHFHKGWPELRVLAGAVVTPKRLTRLITEVIAPLVFPTVDSTFHDVGPHQVRIENHLEPGARPCEAFFRATSGSLRGLPRNLGLGPAIVRAEYDGVHGVYDVSLPAPPKGAPGSVALVGRALTRFVRSLALGNESSSELPSAFAEDTNTTDLDARVELARERWQATPKQCDVLRFLAQGKGNREIAELLACSEKTIELHVGQLLKRSASASRSELIARFWSAL